MNYTIFVMLVKPDIKGQAFRSFSSANQADM